MSVSMSVSASVSVSPSLSLSLSPSLSVSVSVSVSVSENCSSIHVQLSFLVDLITCGVCEFGSRRVLILQMRGQMHVGSLSGHVDMNCGHVDKSCIGLSCSAMHFHFVADLVTCGVCDFGSGRVRMLQMRWQN